MKLVVPYIGEVNPLDARMLRLAEFLGITCETLPLGNVAEYRESLETTVSDRSSCFVVNAQVIKDWTGAGGVPAGLVALLLSRFRCLLVHGLRVGAFDGELVGALSHGRLTAVDTIDGDHHVYAVAKDSKDVCEAFSGLSFGPADPVNDHVFCVSKSGPAVKQLISIDGRPFMAAVTLEGAEVLFVASEDIADLNAEVGDAPLVEYFSRLVPHAMALRYAAADECWRPPKAQASIIIDDPLLRRSYGFLNFGSLLRLADQHDFHATIAFIPHNFRRSSPRITGMFRENAKRLSLCFHGNDHTGAEFASSDMALLNTLVQVAEDRMNLHQRITSLPCDKIMVFPQGNFSTQAMAVLKSHNFYAAVNTVPDPVEQPVRLTIGELAQPAVLRYEGFPLFLRKPIRQMQNHDMAFNLFFGRPVLIVEHHQIFQHPEVLAEIVARINLVASGAQWSNLATVVGNSILTRRAHDSTHHVRAYSGTVQISNDSTSTRRYSIEWGDSCDSTSVEQVLVDGAISRDFKSDDAGIRLSVELDPGVCRTFSLVHRNAHASVRKLGLRWNTQAFLRRRLSEIRDDYLSKNEHLLRAAKAIQRRFLNL